MRPGRLQIPPSAVSWQLNPEMGEQLAGIKSIDVIVPVRRAAGATALRLRVVTTPEPATAQLLAHLGLRLPKGFRAINNVVPKTQG